jgi:TolB-like protein
MRLKEPLTMVTQKHPDPADRTATLTIPELQQSKTAVLNTVASIHSRRCYAYAIERFIVWYCSEPRLTFNRTVVVRYRSYLEGLHLRRGYRFIAELESTECAPQALASGTVAPPCSNEGFSASESVGEPPQVSKPTAIPGFHFLTKKVWSMAALAALAALLIVASNVGGWRDRLLRRQAVKPIQSLAVLPLENLSRDPEQEYFAEGMTDEMITALAKIGALRVVSRTSVTRYRGTKKPLPEIARELRVDAIVEGTVLRAHNRVRITAQLVRASPEEHLWAQRYEGSLEEVLTCRIRWTRERLDPLAPL